MSGPKTTRLDVVSPEELQRREDASRKRNCKELLSRIKQLNRQLLSDCQVHVVDEHADETHDSLIQWEKALAATKRSAQMALLKQRENEQRCRLLEEQIQHLSADLTHPEEFALHKPAIATSNDLQQWEATLTKTLEEAEYVSERDPFFLKRQAGKKFDLTGVDLGRKEDSRIEEIRSARRMDKLQKLASSISEIDDDELRESLVYETTPLLDKDSDDDFDETIIQLNTRVREIKKAQTRRADALEEAAKIKHLDSDEAQAILQAAEQVDSSEGLADIRKRVAALLDAENRELDEQYIRQAIKETLTELGYDYGEGFEQTEYGLVAYAEKDPDSDYAVRLQLGNDGSNLMTRVVSRGDTTAAQDANAEEELCADYHALRQGLSDRGVEAVLTREAKPGEYPLDKIGRSHAQEVSHAYRKRQARASRQMNQRRLVR